jgi:hypothetical protein
MVFSIGPGRRRSESASTQAPSRLTFQVGLPGQRFLASLCRNTVAQLTGQSPARGPAPDRHTLFSRFTPRPPESQRSCASRQFTIAPCCSDPESLHQQWVLINIPNYCPGFLAAATNPRLPQSPSKRAPLPSGGGGREAGIRLASVSAPFRGGRAKRCGPRACPNFKTRDPADRI